MWRELLPRRNCPDLNGGISVQQCQYSMYLTLSQLHRGNDTGILPMRVIKDLIVIRGIKWCYEIFLILEHFYWYNYHPATEQEGGGAVISLLQPLETFRWWQQPGNSSGRRLGTGARLILPHQCLFREGFGRWVRTKARWEKLIQSFHTFRSPPVLSGGAAPKIGQQDLSLTISQWSCQPSVWRPDH